MRTIVRTESSNPNSSAGFLANSVSSGPQMVGGLRMSAAFCLLLSAFCFLAEIPVMAQETEQTPPPDQSTIEEEKLPPGDWAVELIDQVAASPNPDARDALYRAVMAAGPGVIPQLEQALKDDRTAEFAAQSLAYLGGEKALRNLWELVSDPRDLNLRRFYYGALAEFDAPDATQSLLTVIKRADNEPDRTVTEAAILALTVRSDARLVPPLQEALANTKDVVIRLDIENAIEVIGRRAKYLASPQKKAGGSLDQAVRTYFAPALESAPPVEISPPAPKASASRTGAARPPVRTTVRTPPAPKPEVNVQIRELAFSPDKSRALARVIFEDPSASASYDMVLQKQYGDWAVASVWLGAEVEKAVAKPQAPEPDAEN
jgi:hypothetical protein